MSDTRRLIAYVWWCGDDYCDCTQPVIQAHHHLCRHLSFEGTEAHRFEGEYLWEGEFRSGGDGYGVDAYEELGAVLRAMSAHWPVARETTIDLGGNR